MARKHALLDLARGRRALVAGAFAAVRTTELGASASTGDELSDAPAPDARPAARPDRRADPRAGAQAAAGAPGGRRLGARPGSSGPARLLAGARSPARAPSAAQPSSGSPSSGDDHDDDHDHDGDLDDHDDERPRPRPRRRRRRRRAAMATATAATTTGTMTDHVARLYALALGSLVFLVAWAVVAANPFPEAKAASDPRLVALQKREARLAREQRAGAIASSRAGSPSIEREARRAAATPGGSTPPRPSPRPPPRPRRLLSAPASAPAAPAAPAVQVTSLAARHVLGELVMLRHTFTAMGDDGRGAPRVRPARPAPLPSLAVEAEFERLEGVLSRFRPDSALSAPEPERPDRRRARPGARRRARPRGAGGRPPVASTRRSTTPSSPPATTAPSRTCPSRTRQTLWLRATWQP